jgi:hypothetical protein
MNDMHKSHFHSMIECPQEYYLTHGRHDFLKAKTFLYELSPFSQTLFLDADMLWLPKRSVNEIFDMLKDFDFTIQSRSVMDLDKITNEKQIQWAKSSDIKKKYGSGKLFNVSSEFIYFKKKPKIKKMFKDAQKIHVSPGISNAPFAGAVADELSFACSMLKNNIEPHQEIFRPCYWEAMQHQRLQAPSLYQQYYAYSFGGAFASPYEQKMYNNLAQHYCNQFGVQYFPLRQKRSFDSTRSII